MSKIFVLLAAAVFFAVGCLDTPTNNPSEGNSYFDTLRVDYSGSHVLNYEGTRRVDSTSLTNEAISYLEEEGFLAAIVYGDTMVYGQDLHFGQPPNRYVWRIHSMADSIGLSPVGFMAGDSLIYYADLHYQNMVPEDSILQVYAGSKTGFRAIFHRCNSFHSNGGRRHWGSPGWINGDSLAAILQGDVDSMTIWQFELEYR